VLVLRHAAARAVEDVGEVLLAQRFDGQLDRRLVVGDDGVAVVLLVAGGRQRVQGERVVLGRRDLLLDERPEHARLFLVK
jgi:hypothetical protein